MSEVKIVVSAQDNASKVFAQVRSSMDTAAKAAGLLGTAMGLVGIAGIGGLIAMTRGVVDGIDAFNDLKDATGASIENISALEDIAGRTGTRFEVVGASLIKFNTALKDAKPGSEQEAAFKALSLSVKELRDLDPAEALLKTATAFAGVADDGNKARLAQELFGKSLKDIAPFLNDLAEKGALVATVTEDQAKQAEIFNKQLFEMQKNIKDASRTLTSEFLPALNDILTLYNQQGLGAAIDGIGNKLFDWEGSQSKKMVGWIKADLASLKEQSDSITVDLFGKKGKLAKDIEAKTAELAAAEAAYFKLTSGSVGGGRGSVNPSFVDARASVGVVGAIPVKKSGEKTQAEQLTRDQQALAAYVKTLDGALTTTEKLSEKQKALDFLKGLGTTGDIAQVRELVLGQADLVDTLRAQEEAQKALAEARKRSDAYFESIRKEQQALEDTNKTLSDHIAEIGLTAQSLNDLKLKRLDDAIATQEQSTAQLNLQNSSEEEIAQAQRKIALLKEQRSLSLGSQVAQASADTKADQEKAAKEFANTLHGDLKGAFSAALRDTSGEPLQAFGDALANVIYSRAATSLAESLIGAAGGTGGGSVLASLFSLDGGGYTGGGARAGGLDGKGGFMAMLHPNETVLDHSKGQSGGGAVTVVQNFTVGDVVSVSMLRAAVAGSEQRIAGAVARSRTYGGALS
jgi:hypothetical protein